MAGLDVNANGCMALTERRITIRLHYIYSGPRAKADRARLGHWFIYLLWGCTTPFALGTSVTCVSYGRDSEGCSSAPLRISQPYFTSEWLETEKHQHSGFSEKRDRMCPHRGQNNIEAKIWEHKLVTKVEKINYFVTGTSKTHGELKRGDQTRTFMFENIHNNLNRQTAVSHLSLLIDYSV